MGATAHLDFIAAAYAAAIIIIGALIAWVTLDYRAQLQTLAELDEQGVSRRSKLPRAAPTVEQAKAAAQEQTKERA